MKLEELEKGMIVHDNLAHKRMSVLSFQGDKVWCSYLDKNGDLKEYLISPEQLIKGEPPSSISFGNSGGISSY